MRIEQLEYVAAVSQHGSLRRAAQDLHISQPALGEAVSNLERELGVTLLDRTRSGTKASPEGEALMPYVAEILDAVQRLRGAIGDGTDAARTVRLGTVNAATLPVVTPALGAFTSSNPSAQVDIVPTRQTDIRRMLLDGQLDVGLVNIFPDDELPGDLDATLLLTGHVVACVKSGSPLAARTVIRAEDLDGQILIGMRSGYLMHRFVHRLFGNRVPPIAYATDGAEMGKVMVAAGLGVTLLPGYSVVGDPLEREGLITTLPIEGIDTRVELVLQRRRPASRSPIVDEFCRQLTAQARRLQAAALPAPD